MKHWIVLPAYNEEDALPLLLTSIFKTFAEAKREVTVVVVNDGSQDGTRDRVLEFGLKYPVHLLDNPKNMGLAETIKLGLIEACKIAAPEDVIITMDADNTHPAGLALRMSRTIIEGGDVVIASRFQNGSRVRGVSFPRKALSILGSLYFRILFPMEGVKDYTCGYRAYRAILIQRLFKKYGTKLTSERGFSCMVDILLRLREEDPIVVEVPLILRYDLKPTLSKMRVFTTIRDSILLGLRRRFGAD
jgi:dolichol-phosphate mannosyltransferase